MLKIYSSKILQSSQEARTHIKNKLITISDPRIEERYARFIGQEAAYQYSQLENNALDSIKGNRYPDRMQMIDEEAKKLQKLYKPTERQLDTLAKLETEEELTEEDVAIIDSIPSENDFKEQARLTLLTSNKTIEKIIDQGFRFIDSIVYIFADIGYNITGLIGSSIWYTTPSGLYDIEDQLHEIQPMVDTDTIIGIENNVSDAKTKQKNKPIAKQQVLALEYILDALGVENMQDADKTKVVKLIQFITGNEFGKTAKDTSIYKYIWTDQTDNKNYNKYIDEIATLFNDIGLVELANKVKNSKI